MDCFHQTNKQQKKKFCTVLQNQREATAEEQMRVKKAEVYYISLQERHAEASHLDTETTRPRETADHTDPTQANDEHSTQKSAKYMEEIHKTKR